jgi:hypothetical protein
MPLLLQVMAEVDASGRVPQPFAAYDKQYPHFFGPSCIAFLLRWHHYHKQEGSQNSSLVLPEPTGTTLCTTGWVVID